MVMMEENTRKFDWTEPTSSYPGEWQDRKRVAQLKKNTKFLRRLIDENPRERQRFFLQIIEIRELEWKFGEPSLASEFNTTEEEITKFILNDRYITANLLREELRNTINKEINQAIKSIRSKYSKMTNTWLDYTKRGCKQHE